MDGLCFQKTLHRFRRFKSAPSAKFVQMIFLAYLHTGVFREAASLTVNIAHITLERIKPLRFPLPPLAEQERIVAEVERRLSVVKELEDTIEANERRARLSNPACGTGGFLLAAHDYVTRHNPNLNREQKKHLKLHALKGVELVDAVSRLCAMNLLLHGIGPTSGEDVNPPVRTDDSLSADPGEPVHVVLTNPPFGKKSSVMVVNEEGEEERQALTIVRDDFWASTSNKQLNFVQHVKSILRVHGRAAVVVPDNVLFEGGAGETIRRKLLEECDVHTLLRLPTGIFYAQGVKANVLFFDLKPPAEEPWTKQLWVYDLRTNMHFTLKANPLKRADHDEFVSCYRAENRHQREPLWLEENPSGRRRPHPYEELVARDKASLDLFWLRDESLEGADSLPEPDVIAADIAEDLRAALAQFEEIEGDLAAAS